MELKRDPVYHSEIHETKTGRVSWPAIFGGALIMLITLMLLSLLGVGIGIGTINPMEETKPMQGLGTGALVWWVISNIMAVFAGAYTAAKLTNVTYKLSGIMHGILSWSLYTLITFWLMTSAVGAIISGVGGAVSKSLSAVGAGVSEIPSLTDQVNPERVKILIQDALAENQELGSRNGQEFDIDLMAVAREVFIKNGEINTNVDRQEVEQAVARHSTLTQSDAERATDVIITEYEKARVQLQEVAEKARETGQQVAEAVSRAAIWAFIALMLGVITAAIGGRVGRPDVVSDPTRSASR